MYTSRIILFYVHQSHETFSGVIHPDHLTGFRVESGLHASLTYTFHFEGMKICLGNSVTARIKIIQGLKAYVPRDPRASALPGNTHPVGGTRGRVVQM
jgi:hypothetical protein